MPEKPNIEEKPSSVLSPTLSQEILIAQADEGSIPLGDPLTFLPMAGGVHTDKETALLKTGEFSSLVNLRPKHPGFQTRKGQLQHHTTSDGANKVLSLFQFQKSKIDEGYFLAQMSDGDILQATDMPPDTTTGVFGSEVHDGGASQIPASWSNIKDRLVYSNGVDQHQVFTGDNSYVDKFIVYDGIDIVHIPTKGVDYTKEVSDGLTTTHADLGSLKPGTITNIGSALSPTACCTDPDNDVDTTGDWEINTTNTTLESVASGVTGNKLEMKQSGSVTSPSLQSPTMALTEGKTYRLLCRPSADTTVRYEILIQHDNTAAIKPYRSGSVTGQGSGTWDTINETFECMRSGDYRIHLNGSWFYTTSGAVWWDNISLYEIQSQYVFVFSPVQASGITWTLPNVNTNASVATIKYHKSDGTWADCSITDNTAVGGVTLAGTGQSMTWTPPSDEITSFMYGRCGFWYQVSVSAELSATVHATKVTYSSQFQDIRNIWDRVPVAPVEVMVEGKSDWSVYAAGAVSLNALTAGYRIRISSVDRIEGILVNPGAAPNNTDAEIDTIKYWDGDSWTTVGTVVDSSDGVKSAGWITFPRQDAQLRQFGSSGFYTYWYEITLTGGLSTCVVLALSTMPYFDIEDYGRGYVNCAWKNRMVYSFGDKYIYISKNHEPGVLNGDDFDARQVGDGRENKVVAMRQFYNELAVWQEEKGVDGGTFTLYEGNSPSTWSSITLSSKLGTFSSKSVVVVESSATSGTMKILLFWISRYGVCMSDGSGAITISWDIQNYFDPSKSECIRRGYEKEMWIAHDSKDDVLLLGLVSGSSATVPNIFPVYDLRSGEWSFDERGQALACVVEIESGSGGDTPILQMGGGVADGTIHKLNYGQHDNGTTITSSETIEIDANGGMLQLKEMLLRVKAQT